MSSVIEGGEGRPEQPEDSYDVFSRMAHAGLGDELARRWIEEIWEDQVEEETLTEEEAFKRLQDLIDRRESARNQPMRLFGEEIPEHVWKEVLHDIHLARSMPGFFLGNGSVAEVFSLNSDQRVCVKVIMSNERYVEGNDVFQESKFLVALDGFEVEGVRTPRLKNVLVHDDVTAITMETLDAANMTRVVEGRDSLPESFDFDDYFRRIEVYLRALHDKGVYHNDFYLRNMMCDNTTGHPRVIDFGKSYFRLDLIGEHAHVHEDLLEKKDFAALEQARAKMRQWLDNQ